MKRRCFVLIASLVAALLPAVAGIDTAKAAQPGEECAPASSPSSTGLTVGVTDCVRLPSAFLGGDVPVSYYIPPACAPAQGRDCPVLYYLHGTGGSYRSALGAKGTSGAKWIRALTSGPPVDIRAHPQPWTYSDPATWVPKPAIDFIIVGPHGRTLPGGFGHTPNHDMGWFDWNPRYARDGDTPRYDTPPPRPSSFLLKELVPFVDTTFPTVADRQWRAIVGYSQGGFGAYINGFTHPDVWSSQGMESGGTLPLVAPGDLADDSVLVTGVAPPTALPFLQLPGLVMSAAPDQAFQENIVSEATLGFGDAVADQAWMRASNPADLIHNVRAWGADGTQSTYLKHFVNDAIPRRVEDYVNLPNAYMGEVFEALLFPMNLYMERIFDRYGVERRLDVGPGNHWDPYQSEYFREQLEGQYANIRHWDGGGSPRPSPVRFDYRTIVTDFDIWGWHLSVADRPAVEFLNLTNVTCSGLTLRGTGKVTVTVPETCGTTNAGQRTFTVDLGPGWAASEPAGLGSSRAYGKTVTVPLR